MTGALRSSPLARKLAAEKGVALTRVVGTGHHGRILRADVLRTAAGPERDRRAAPRRSAEPADIVRVVGADTLGLARDPLEGVSDVLRRLPGGAEVAVVAMGQGTVGDVLEVGPLRREPVLRDGRLAVGSMLPLRLTTDGKGIDPAAAEALLDALRSELGN